MAFLFSGRFSSTCSTCSCTGVTRRVSKLRRCGSAAPEAIVRVNSQNAAGRGGGVRGWMWDAQRGSGESGEGPGSSESCWEGTLGHRNALRWDREPRERDWEALGRDRNPSERG